MWPPEKNQESDPLRCRAVGSLQSRLSSKYREKWACFAYFGVRRAEFLCSPDCMAERVGFEFTRKRSFNNIERTAGTVKQWKAVVGSANGSQTDHGSVIA